MARNKRRLKVPASARRGDSFVIKTLAEHPMETGRRKHLDTGELVPRSLIERLECRYNGQLVFFSNWFTSLRICPGLDLSGKFVQWAWATKPRLASRSFWSRLRNLSIVF